MAYYGKTSVALPWLLMCGDVHEIINRVLGGMRVKSGYLLRLLTMALVLVLLLGSWGGTVCAEEDAQEELLISMMSTTFTGGYGSNGKFLAPIEAPVMGSIPIANRVELEAIANNLSGNYHLTQDIDLSGAEWVPIGNYYAGSFTGRFSGIFDGQGYVIRNLRITGAGHQYNGLFSCANSARIINVGLEGTQISIVDSRNNYVGSLCGYISSSNISNCYNTGNVSVSAKAEYNAIINVGGICGNISKYINSISDTALSYCYNTGDVSITNTILPAIPRAGGICGYSPRDTTYSYCYNTGNVTITSTVEAFAGGIGGIWGTYSNCKNTGDVSANATYDHGHVTAKAGGISSRVDDSSINNCYNIGDVSATAVASDFDAIAYAGGICTDGHIISNCYNDGDVKAIATFTSDSPHNVAIAGGICSYLYSRPFLSSINNCYNTGNVVATSTNNANAGGICGYLVYSSIVNNCYNVGEVSASAATSLASRGGICGNSFYSASSYTVSNSYCIDLYSSQYGTQLTSAQMKTQASYIGFDFEMVWKISSDINNGYPVLRGFQNLPSTGVSVSGAVKYYNLGNNTTIELMQGLEVKYVTTIAETVNSGQVTQPFSIPNVATGNYTFRVSKAGHLSYTKTAIVVDSTDVSCGEITLILGDINGDGQIDSKDLALLTADYGKAGMSITNSFSDLNVDGQVDSKDLALLTAEYGKADVIVP